MKKQKLLPEISRSTKKGLKPHRTGSSAKPSRQRTARDTIQVDGATDQFGRAWLRISKGEAIGYGLLQDLIAQKARFYDGLFAQGIRVATQTTRRAIAEGAERTDLDFSRKVYAISRYGWHGSHYVRPGAELPETLSTKPVANDLTDLDANWEVRGTVDDWKSVVADMVSGQAVLTFAACCSFAALLKSRFPSIGNFGVEFYGETSIGKFSIMLMAASVYGGKEFVRSWDATVNSLEASMDSHRDALLLLDETNHFLEGSTGRVNGMREAIFKLSEGTKKERYGNPATGNKYRTIFLTTSNVPIAEVLQPHTEKSNYGAILTRLISIAADTGSGYGVFDRLPNGCSSSSEAVERLEQRLRQHHGVAGPAFVERLGREQRDPVKKKELKEQCRAWFNEFLEKIEVDRNDGAAHRVAVKFALIFVAGRLAKKWGLLPVSNLRAAVLAAYRSHQRGLESRAPKQPLSAINRVCQYVEQHRAQMIDLRIRRYPKLTDEALDACPGFLLNDGAADFFVVRKTQWLRAFKGAASALLKELKIAGHLHATENNSAQCKVRSNSAKDRVYKVRL